jgi:hypothetical protein
MFKRLSIIIGSIILLIALTASNSVTNKVFLPIIFRADAPERKMVWCNTELRDKGGFYAGFVQARMQLEFHPDFDHLVRLSEFISPDTGHLVLFYWKAYPNTTGSFIQPEINFLWQSPNPDTQWHSYTTVGSGWEAVTHIFGSQGYSIYVYGFPKNNPTSIRCDVFKHD